MTAIHNEPMSEEFLVIHPLFDRPEEKRTGEGLGKMQMSRSVRFSLMLLRGYLILVTMLLAYHLLDLAGVFGHHPR